MILLVTNERDLTTDYIVLELRRRGLHFYRLNSERLPEFSITFNPKKEEDAWSIDFGTFIINFSDIKAAYFRRPGTPSVDTYGSDEISQYYCEVEWGAALTSALNSLGERWLNSPLAILASEDKPRQLSMAHTLGFSVPDTLISNDFTLVHDFSHKNSLVAKPIRQALLTGQDNERVIFTSRIKTLTEEDKPSVTAAPVIYQKEVMKSSDIRVTVVGKSVYAVEIDSQNNEETKTDWRRGSNPDLPHMHHQLPSSISKKCIKLTQELNLRYGAIDLVLDQSGNYWFLEINPNGQWAWIENRVGLPIAKTIVDELVRISSCVPK